VYWTKLAQDGVQGQTVVNKEMNLQVPQMADNFFSSNCATVSFPVQTCDPKGCSVMKSVMRAQAQAAAV
jgi:hypothetical protein